MSYSDVANGVVVGHSDSDKKPTKYPRGEWLRDVFENQNYNPVIEIRSGPAVVIESDKVRYVYEISEHPDALERYKDHLRGEVHKKQIEIEDGGMNVGDVFVETTDGSMAKIMGALDESRGKLDVKRKFNHRKGRIELTLDEMEVIASAIRKHKQDANDWGYDTAGLVDAAITIEELKIIENQI